MSPSSLLKRGTAILALALALLTLGFMMLHVYRGFVVSLNPVGMVQHPLRNDFALYYRDSTVAVRAPAHNPYDMATFVQTTSSMGIRRLKADPVAPSLSLPPLIWLVIPFTLLPFSIANGLWLLLLGACLVLTWALAAPGRGLPKLAHLAAAAIFLPVSFAIADGQAILLVTAGVALSWWLLKHDHEVWAGIVLATLVLKPQLAFLVPVALLVAGRRKMFLGFACSVGLLAGIALVTIPWDALIHWAGRLTQASSDPDLWRVNTTLTAASQGGAIVGLVEDVLIAIVVVIALKRAKPVVIRDDFAVVAGLLASILATPYLHYPDLTILVLGAWIFLRTHPPVWQRWLLFAGYWLSTAELFGFPFTRTLEMVWLICLLQPPLPRVILRDARAALFRGASVQPSRAA